MAIEIIPVGTRIPKLRPHMIETPNPVVAINNTNEHMDLSPIKGLGTGAATYKSGELRSLVKLHTNWLTWTQDINFVKSQIESNAYRYYFTADSGYDSPQSSNRVMSTSGDASTWPTETRPLGVVAPTTPVTVNLYGTEDEKLDEVVVSYVYTYVTDWDEESAPSEVSTVTTIEGGKYVSIQGIVDPDIDYITHVRIYRLVAATSGDADYLAIGVRGESIAGALKWDVPLSQITGESYQLFDCNSITTPTGLSTAGSDVIPSETWVEPPDNMHHLTQHMGSMLLGAYDNVLCISEPMIPYAWPIEYRRTFSDDIVALGTYQSYIVVLTGSYPYIIQGISPLGMVQQRIEQNIGCVSKRGVVSTRVGVIFPAEDGLYIINGANATCITEGLFSAAQWSALTPSSLIGFYWNDCYYGFFTGSDYVIQIELQDGFVLYEMELGVDIYGGYVEELTNDLYLLGKVGEVYRRYKYGGSSSDLDYTWQTKNFRTHPTNFEVLQIISPYDQGDIDVTVLYDWEDEDDYPDPGVYDLTFTNNEFMWLPAGELHRTIAFLITGKSKIDSIKLASSPEELSNG